MTYDTDDVEAPATPWDALTFFCFVATTALCLCFIFAGMMYRLGVPTDPEEFLVTNFIVSAGVAFPTAILAAQHDFKLRVNQRLLKRLAATDPLTGLLNRRFFKRHAAETLERMQRSGETAGLIIFDLDFFKKVNDRYGHSFGDYVLREVAHIAHSELRGPFDRLGRWGGEEFVVLLSDVTLEQAEAVSERLRYQISAKPISDGQYEAQITASFGVVVLNKDSDLHKLLDEADAALISAKRGGRNRVEFAA